MISVHLYGALKDSFGPTHRLEVESAGEAIRALCTVTTGFENQCRQGSYILIRDRTKTGKPYTDKQLSKAARNEDIQLDLDSLHFGIGNSDLHIVPVIGGEGGRGAGKILIGIALVAGAFLAAPLAAVAGAAMTVGGGVMSATAISLGALSVSFGQIALMGAIMALTGVSQMLAKPPEATKPTDKNESFIFSGPANIASQGNVVPVVYGGPIRVGSVTISSSISTESSHTGRLNINGKNFSEAFDLDNDGFVDGTTYAYTENRDSYSVNPESQGYSTQMPNMVGPVSVNPNLV